jgi:hypothetical protein
LSHIVEIQTEVRDPHAVASACRRLGLAEPQQGTTEVFTTQATGLIVQLRNWQFPIVVSPETGQIKYDNFNGHWGAQAELDRFLQAYLVEKTLIEARRKGHTTTEQRLADGSIAIDIVQVGGAA